MNKNGVIAVVVVVVAVVLIGLWAMRSGQQSAMGRMDCSAAPGAPGNLSHTKQADIVTLNWTAPGGKDAISTYQASLDARYHGLWERISKPPSS